MSYIFMTRHFNTSALLILSTLFLLVPLSSAHADVGVSIGDNYYSPQTTTIMVGTTVRWTNAGMYPHTVTADNGSFDSGTINSGSTYSRTFNTPGTYYYYCKLHHNMRGKIVVAGSPQPYPTPYPYPFPQQNYPSSCGSYYSYLCGGHQYGNYGNYGNYNYNYNYNQNYPYTQPYQYYAYPASYSYPTTYSYPYSTYWTYPTSNYYPYQDQYSYPTYNYPYWYGTNYTYPPYYGW